MSKLAIKGGTPVRTKPFTQWPIWDESDIKAVEDVVRSGDWFRISGGRCARKFEKAFAEYQGAKYGLAVATGTAALEIALKSCGIGPGDEVIVPPYTFMATATSVLSVNAVPIFADIDSETCNIDPISVEKLVTHRTRAIIVVHFGGLPVDMDRILEIARKYKLWVIEDAAHGHGGKWKGLGLGSIGDIGTFSFCNGKNMSSGEGGAMITNDEKLHYTNILYHDFWRGALEIKKKDEELPAWLKRFPVLAWNYRLGEFQAAILLNQMNRIEAWSQTREKNGKYLSNCLNQFKGIRNMKVDDFVTRHAYHIFVFRYQNDYFKGLSKDKFIAALEAEGINCSGGYMTPIYEHPIFLEWETSLVKGFPLSDSTYSRPINYKECETPNAKLMCSEAIWINQNVLLGDERDMQDIVDAVAKIQENIDELL
jgi:Predicted pyridoxal phosphate-dependent enzyme apparently involved in regulation of cell wall biogenesis